MPTAEGLPLPGDQFAAGRTDLVIASAWSDREGEDGVAYVILLRPEPPYYSVLLLRRRASGEASGWLVRDEQRVHNIQEAAQVFEDYGGPARSDFSG